MFSSILLAALSASMPTPQIKIDRVGSNFNLRLGNGAIFRQTQLKPGGAQTLRLANGQVIGLWKEAGQPMYLVSNDGATVLREAQSDLTIHLKAGLFDPLRGLPETSASIVTPKDNDVFIVQFKTQPLPEYLAEIEGLGANVYDTVAPNAAIVKLPTASLRTIKSLAFVRWVGAYESAYRLDPALGTALDEGTLGTRTYNIWCHQRGAEMQNQVAGRVTTLGGTVVSKTPEGFIMSATLTPLQLVQILAMNEVGYVDEKGEPSPDMDIVRATGGANFIETTLGFTGQGVRAEVMDGGLRLTHVAWGNAPLVHAPSNVTDSHGTATYGINFGNGTGNAAGRGMVPDAQGVIGRYNAMSGGNRYTHTAQLLQSPYFCVYQSNSWGDTQTTAYSTISAEMDDILFINDICVLNSQSNTGTRSSRPQAWAKNIVSIGGVRHFNNTNPADDTWGNGASIGPAADGRFKPDLAHYYDSILCPTSTSDTAYQTGFGGTSAATPITAGHFGLFYQMWNGGVFGNPAPATTVFDNRPKATLTKAIMINTANQYSLAPQQADITRWVQGWGKVDLTNLYGIRNNWCWVNETDVLQNLETATYRMLVAPSTGALRLTMVFSDPAGTPGAAVARKNNLSLKVTGPTGTQYWGNNGMAASNWTAAGGSEDSINTVENVYIQNPPAGIYTVQVIGSDINTDARTETPGVVDADFALVATGVQNTNLAPTSFSVDDGGLVSGGLSDLANSDNSVVQATRGITGSRFFKSTVNLGYTSPSATVSKMTFTVERRDNVAGVTETIEALEVGTGNWIQIGTGNVPQADGLNMINVTNPQRFVGSGGAIALRCRYERQDTFGNRTSPVAIDYARLKIEP